MGGDQSRGIYRKSRGISPEARGGTNPEASKNLKRQPWTVVGPMFIGSACSLKRRQRQLEETLGLADKSLLDKDIQLSKIMEHGESPE